MITLLHHILNNGVSVNNTDSLNRKIKISNLILMIIAVVMVLYTPLYIYLGEKTGVLLNSSYLITSIIAYLMIHQKKYIQSFCLYILGSYLYFIFTTLAYGTKINLHYFLFIICMICVVVFNSLQTVRICLLICIASFFLLAIRAEYYPPWVIIPSQTATQEMVLGYVNLLLFFIIGCIFTLFFKGIMIANQNRIIEQKNIIEQRNQDFVESVLYAQRIQSAMLPNKSSIKAMFKDHFLFFKPKDIVSGDFYWTHETADYQFVAVGDCTGHGVPGALMSVLGINILIEVVENRGVSEPATILNNLRNGILLAFDKDQSSSEYKDGMDISLVRIDRKNKTYVFAGANNNLLHINKDEYFERKSDRQPVGYSYDFKSFSQEEFLYESGDLLVFYTDGYADQFGGPHNKKFKTKQLYELLFQQQNSNMEKTLEENYFQWKKDLEQVDDVCILGVRME